MKQGWEIKKLGEVCDIICGQDYKSVQDENGQYPIYGTGGIMGYASQYRCPANSVIIGRKGNINSPIYVEQPFWNVDTAFGVVPNKNIIHPQFFYLFCRDYDFSKHDVSVTIPSLRRVDIIQIPVPVPPREEQERIVEELDCLSGVIEKKREQLRELDALAQSIFYQMFGDPITNEKRWEVKKLSDAVSIDCPISYGIVQPMDDVEGGIPIVRPIDLVDTFVRKDNLKRTSVDISNAYKRTILRGDEILMCVRGTTGVVSMASDELKGCNTTRGIVPLFFDSINRWFVYYLIKQPSMQCLIAENTYGIALKQINIKELRLLPIITPPLSFQQEFADKIEAIEKQKELIKQSITETEELFNSRMDYYFN